MLAIMSHDCPEICLFIFGVKDFYEMLADLKCTLRMFGHVLIDAVIYSPRLLNLSLSFNLLMSLIGNEISLV